MAQSTNKILSFLAIFLGCSYLVACATGSPLAKNMAADQPAKIPQPAAVTITVAPASASLRANSTISFKASVSGTSNSAVMWSVNSTPGGSDTVGTIDASGNYTAPPSVPSPNTISVTATTVADKTNSAPGSITLLNPTPSLATISPTSVKAGSFTLNITGSGFVPGAHVLIGSSYLNTTFVSPTHLTASGSSSSTGSFAITVQNPDPGGSTSSAASFEVSAAPPTTPTQPKQPSQPTSPSSPTGTTPTQPKQPTQPTSPSSPTGTPTTLSPSFPVVTGGGTQQFTGSPSGGTYSCTGCKGTINATTGVYTAPSTITPQQAVGGYQLLPNNHVFNVNISSLPVNTNSVSWLKSFNSIGSMVYNYGIPLNFLPSGATQQAQVFVYSPANNGNFYVPVFPYGLIQDGWTNAIQGTPNFGIDHHLFSIYEPTGLVEEMYQYYPAGSNSTCATCTSQSGIQYLTNSYTLPPIATSASGMQILPLTIHLQELHQALATCTNTTDLTGCGSINHAIDMTFDSNLLSESFIWPATTNAGVSGGVMPYGVRWRLNPSFPISSYNAETQILLTQLQNYGTYVVDGGPSWDMTLEYAPWTPADLAAFNNVALAQVDTTLTAVSISSLVATITAPNALAVGNLVRIGGLTSCTALNNNGGLGGWVVTSATSTSFTFAVPSGTANCSATESGTVVSPIVNYMQAVDESSLELSATSGEANTNRETVTYTTSGGSTSQDVILQGVSLNFLQNQMTVMAGTYPNPIQIGYNITGTTNTAVTWSMSPTGYGSISSTGLYTPPATLANGTVEVITVTATSAANPNAFATMQLNICPNVGCYFIGSVANGTNYTDASGNIWVGDPGFPAFNQPQNINFASEYQSSFTGTGNKALFQHVVVSMANDSHFWIYTPPGTYQVTFNTSAFLPPGNSNITFAGQGSTLVSNVDMTANSVGQFGPFTYQTNLTVGSNQFLQFSEFAPDTISTGSPVPTSNAFWASVGVAPVP